jgi:hypothetical protein
MFFIAYAKCIPKKPAYLKALSIKGILYQKNIKKAIKMIGFSQNNMILMNIVFV